MTCACSAWCRARRRPRSARRRCRWPATRRRRRRAQRHPPARSPSSAARSLLLGGAVAAWRWQESKAADLAGRWRADIGKKGATTSRGGEIVNVTIEQSGASLRVASSAVDIEQDPDWQKYRDVLEGAFRPAARPRLLSRRRRPAARRRRRRRRAGRSAPHPSLGARRSARRRRSDRHRRLARHRRSRRQADPRPALAQQRAGRAGRRPAARALAGPVQRTAATVLRAGGRRGRPAAWRAPLRRCPRPAGRFSRHSGMPPRNQ